MAKQRVYELARDLGLESKDVLERAQELEIEVKTASSGLDEDSAALVRLSFEEASSDQLPAAGTEPKVEEEAASDEQRAASPKAEAEAEVEEEPEAEAEANL